VSLLERLEEKQKQAQEEEDSLSAGEVLTSAVANIPSSAVQLAKDVTYPIRHPIQTAQSLASLGKGVVKLIIPGEPTIYDEDEEAAKAVGKFFADRYGSFDAFKQTFATDPLGVASDVAIIFTMGAGASAKVPGVAGKTTQTIGSIGTAIDPVLGGAKLLGATVEGAGKVTAPLLGLTTGAGTDAIQVAARAGASNPDVQRMFLDNLRGDVAPEEIVPKAISALKDKQTTTRSKFKKDKKTLQLEKTPINFSKITNDIKTFESGYKFEGVSELSKKAQLKLSDLKKIVKEFEKNPKLHNAKGLDILKRRIDAEYPTGLNVGDSGVVVTELRNLVKSKILDEVPRYGKVMKDYELAIKLERQFMQELSIGKNKQAGTTLRKLQSALRNNVNTSYGNRLNMLEDLDPSLITEIGGQALSSITPRGLQGLSASGVAGYGAFVNPTMLAGLPFQSPRLVGETAFKIGQLEKSLKPLQGQTALDIARGLRLTGEVMRADDIDNAELLKLLLDNKTDKELDNKDVNTIKAEALELSKEFNESEEEETFAEGGAVIDEEPNIAEKILRKVEMTFDPNVIQNTEITNQIVPLQRISNDAQSSKYNDQVFAELQKYVDRLQTELQQNRTIPLQRFKNIVDRTIDNEIDRGFVNDDANMQEQLTYAPKLYESYIGLEKTDEPFEIVEKTANKMLERVINKQFSGEETANFLLAHNKFAPKDSAPLFIGKLEATLPQKKFDALTKTLKDAMKLKVFSDKGTLTKKLNENKELFNTLFSNQELDDLRSFEQMVVPEVSKQQIMDEKQTPFLITSALAKSNMLGENNNAQKDTLQTAKQFLRDIKQPLVKQVETSETMPSGMQTIPEITVAVEQATPMDNNMLQQDLSNFALPMSQEPVFDMPQSNLTPPEMLSPTILPDEKDREIAMRQMGGLGSLV
tara:strand:- start:56 stop:2830 length:2775 start_codon:yes stop_codon:yes gene_type:complete